MNVLIMRLFVTRDDGVWTRKDHDVAEVSRGFLSIVSSKFNFFSHLKYYWIMYIYSTLILCHWFMSLSSLHHYVDFLNVPKSF